MLKYSSYVYLRYVLLINIIAALIPAMCVKGRANDPLLHSSWWTADQHSAIMVVCLAALLSSTLVFLAIRKGIRHWWVFVVCGIVAGDFPATFYWVAAANNPSLPISEMYVDGTVCGVIAGVVLTMFLGTRKRSASA